VEVRIGSGQGQARATLTDDEGRFEFRNVAPGAHTATATKTGYLADGEGPAARPTPRTLELANGQVLERIDFELTKASTVIVRVLDPFGDPLPGAEVYLQRSRNEDGVRRLEAVTTPGRPRSMTDDRGELRVFGLRPGEYYIQSHMRDGLFANINLTDRTYVATHYPGTSSEVEAQALVVGQGQEVHVEMVQVAEADTRAPAGTSLQQSPGGRASNAPGPPTGRIRGRVLAAETGAPLVRAQVRQQGGMTRVTTDGQGRYDLTVPAGRHRLSAGRNGYLRLSYGQRGMLDPGRWVELNAGETLDDVDFRLPKAGVVVVLVTDETGEPVQGVSVGLLQPRYIAGVRRLTQVVSSIPQGSTDDRGEVRLSGLAAGEYCVSATVLFPTFARRDAGRAYAPTYFPGTLSAAEAVAVFVTPGQEQVVTLPLMAARAATVSGTVLRSDGWPLHQPSVSLNQTIGSSMLGQGTVTQANGTFSFRNVFPGEYSLNVAERDVEKPEANEFASVRLTVTGEDISGLVVTTSKGGSARGRVTFDAGIPGDIRPGAIRLTATPALSAAIAAPDFVGLARQSDPAWQDDWTFSIAGLNSHRLLRLESGNSSGWFLKAVMLDGRDVTETALDFDGGREVKGLEVILTRKRSEVSGDVREARGQAARDFVVVLFSEDDRYWTPDSRFVATGRADQQGRFRIGEMPDGAYLIAAVDFLESGEERDPELLRQLRSRATRLTLGEGETRTISLRLQGR
jgi:protocatechuate 3,4-dioxygenase beta subunit